MSGFLVYSMRVLQIVYEGWSFAEHWSPVLDMSFYSFSVLINSIIFISWQSCFFIVVSRIG